MDENPSILNHISIGVSDLKRAATFYDVVLAPLGCRRIEEMDVAIAWGKVFPEFWIGLPLNQQAANPGNGVHIALTAPSQDAVDAFFAGAIANGGTSDGEPGLRPYAPGYYAAYVFDPDGNKIEAMYMPNLGAAEYLEATP